MLDEALGSSMEGHTDGDSMSVKCSKMEAVKLIYLKRTKFLKYRLHVHFQWKDV